MGHLLSISYPHKFIIENSADTYHLDAVHVKPSLPGKMIESSPSFCKLEQVYSNFTWTACDAPQSHKAVITNEFSIRIKDWAILRIPFTAVICGPYTVAVHTEIKFLGLNLEIKQVVGIIPLHSNKMNFILRLNCGKSFLSKLIGRLMLAGLFISVSYQMEFLTVEWISS